MQGHNACAGTQRVCRYINPGTKVPEKPGLPRAAKRVCCHVYRSGLSPIKHLQLNECILSKRQGKRDFLFRIRHLHAGGRSLLTTIPVSRGKSMPLRILKVGVSVLGCDNDS